MISLEEKLRNAFDSNPSFYQKTIGEEGMKNELRYMGLLDIVRNFGNNRETENDY